MAIVGAAPVGMTAAVALAKEGGGAFPRQGAGWTTGRSFHRGEKILEFQMPDGPDDKSCPMYNLQQQYIEQFLWQAVQTNDLIAGRVAYGEARRIVHLFDARTSLCQDCILLKNENNSAIPA